MLERSRLDRSESKFKPKVVFMVQEFEEELERMRLPA
jgi:hypothetical protein